VQRAGAILSSMVLAVVLGGCINFWEAYEDPPSGSGSSGPLPEPSWKELASGMMLQTYFVAGAPGRPRFAMRRCKFVDGMAERCEITFIDGERVVDRVPTFHAGEGEWADQAKAARKAVVRAMKRWLGRDRVALTRLGTFGRFVPEEGLVSARVEHGQVLLSLMRSDGRPGDTVGGAALPAGLAAIGETYVSERARPLYLVELTVAGGRDNGFVVFARVGPGSYRTIASVGPLQ
jgi:hypothetical protein